LVISTWLNLSLSNFTTWLNIHITISIVILVTLLLKLAFHWRWIVRTTRKIWARPVIAPAKNVVLRPVKVSSGRMGRREFLQVIGVVGAASFLALTSASKSLAETVATTESTVTEDVATQTDLTSTVNTSFQFSSSSSDSSCTLRCQKSCSYPGHCHRYVDTNNNDRCDYGECV